MSTQKPGCRSARSGLQQSARDAGCSTTRHEEGAMDCTQVERLLRDLPLRCLDLHSREEVARHVRDCPRCREVWNAGEDSQWFHLVFPELRVAGSVRDTVMARLKAVIVRGS